MAESAIEAVFDAVKAKLDSDGDVTSKIFNAVKDDETGDFLRLGDFEEEPDPDAEGFIEPWRRIFFEVEAVTDYMGDLAATQLLKPAVASLDRQSISVTGYKSHKVRLVSTAPSAVTTIGGLLRTSMSARFSVRVVKE